MPCWTIRKVIIPMKKVIAMLLSLILVTLCSCGTPAENNKVSNTPSESTSSEANTPTSGNTGSSESSASDTEDNLDAVGKVEVDKNLFDVTITVPADYVGEVTQEDLDKQAAEAGYKSITLNEDGSATWVMTKAQHAEMMDEMVESIDQSLSEMVGSDEYPNFSSVEANDDYTDFTITVTSETLDMSESFCVLGLSMQSALYHIFNGTIDEVDNVHVAFVSADTGEVIDDWNSSESQD